MAHRGQCMPQSCYGASRNSKRRQGERGSTPTPHHAAGRRLSLMGRPFGELSSILCDLTRAGDRTLQVSRHETLEKPDNVTIICKRPCGCIVVQGSSHNIASQNGQAIDRKSASSFRQPLSRHSHGTETDEVIALAVSVPPLHDLSPATGDSTLTFLFARANANPGSGSRATNAGYSPRVRATTEFDCAVHPVVVYSQSSARSKSVQVTDPAIQECLDTRSHWL